MDSQLKKRLTGAVILVILAVLIVPALLTGPKQPVSRSVPSDDSAPLRSYTIDLTAATPPRATPQSGPAAVAPTASSSPVAASPVTAAAPAPASAAPPSQGQAPQPAAAPQVVAPQVTVPQATAPLPRSPAATSPAATRESSEATGFAVQLGSFANVDTARRLAKELRDKGFKVSLAPVQAGGRELQRVRVGPVATRAAAETLASKLAAAGHKGPVVPFP